MLRDVQRPTTHHTSKAANGFELIASKLDGFVKNLTCGFSVALDPQHSFRRSSNESHRSSWLRATFRSRRATPMEPQSHTHWRPRNCLVAAHGDPLTSSCPKLCPMESISFAHEICWPRNPKIQPEDCEPIPDIRLVCPAVT